MQIYRYKIICCLLIMLIAASIKAQHPQIIRVYTPVPGQFAMMWGAAQNAQLAIVDTITGEITQQVSGTFGNSPQWNISGTKIVYYGKRSTISTYDLATNALNMQPIQTNPSKINFEPVDWSYDDSNILYQTFYVTTNWYSTFSLFDTLSGNLTTLRSYVGGQEVTDIPKPGVPAEAVLEYSVLRRNPIYDEWVVVLTTLRHHTILDGEPVDIDYHIYTLWNYVTDQMISINNLLPEVRAIHSIFSWSPDGRLLTYITKHPSGLGHDYHLIHFEPNGSLSVLKSVNTRHIIVGWLGVEDILLTLPPKEDILYDANDPTQFYVAQVIDGILYDRLFIDLPNIISVTDTDFYLRANETEKHELSCLFDLALPQQLSQGIQATNLLAQSLHTEPDPEATTVATLNVGDTATIIGHRACTDNVRWWQITTSSGAVGWAREADNTQYYLHG